MPHDTREADIDECQVLGKHGDKPHHNRLGRQACHQPKNLIALIDNFKHLHQAIAIFLYHSNNQLLMWIDWVWGEIYGGCDARGESSIQPIDSVVGDRTGGFGVAVRSVVGD